jgi:hypothetical protein
MKAGKMNFYIELLKCQGFKLAEKEGRKIIYAYVDETRQFPAESGRIYMDLVMFETPNSEYSDYAVSESKKLDEEIELPIIGNFKNWKKKEETATPEIAKDDTHESADDLPF